jgi:hypothetical protein
VTVALLDEPSDAELRDAWLRANRVARGASAH